MAAISKKKQLIFTAIIFLLPISSWVFASRYCDYYSPKVERTYASPDGNYKASLVYTVNHDYPIPTFSLDTVDVKLNVLNVRTGVTQIFPLDDGSSYKSDLHSTSYKVVWKGNHKMDVLDRSGGQIKFTILLAQSEVKTIAP